MKREKQNLAIFDFKLEDNLVSLMEYKSYHFCIKVGNLFKNPGLYGNTEQDIMKNSFWKKSDVFYLYNMEEKTHIDITEKYFERFPNLYNIESSIYNLKKLFQQHIEGKHKIESNNSNFGGILIHFMDLFYIEQNESPFNYIPELKILLDMIITTFKGE